MAQRCGSLVLEGKQHNPDVDHCNTDQFASLLLCASRMCGFLDVLGAGFGTGTAAGHEVSFVARSQRSQVVMVQHLCMQCAGGVASTSAVRHTCAQQRTNDLLTACAVDVLHGMRSQRRKWQQCKVAASCRAQHKATGSRTRSHAANESDAACAIFC